MIDEPLDWLNVWSFAKNHSLEIFVALYMKKIHEELRPNSELQSEISTHCATLLAIHGNQKAAVASIHSALERMKCYHLFIKGTVTNKRYEKAFY